MKKIFILSLGFILIFTSCNQSNTHIDKGPNIYKDNLLGGIYKASLNERGREALKFIQNEGITFEEVTQYRRQTVNGTNHYFELTQNKKPPMEIIVYESLNGDFEIISKGILE